MHSSRLEPKNFVVCTRFRDEAIPYCESLKRTCAVGAGIDKSAVKDQVRIRQLEGFPKGTALRPMEL